VEGAKFVGAVSQSCKQVHHVNHHPESQLEQVDMWSRRVRAPKASRVILVDLGTMVGMSTVGVKVR